MPPSARPTKNPGNFPASAGNRRGFPSRLAGGLLLGAALFLSCTKPSPPPRDLLQRWGMARGPVRDDSVPPLLDSVRRAALGPAGGGAPAAATAALDSAGCSAALLLRFPRASAAVVAWEEAQNFLETRAGRPVPVPASAIRQCVWFPWPAGSGLGLARHREYLLLAAGPDTALLCRALRAAAGAWAEE